MRSLIHNQHGDPAQVLRLEEVPDPAAPTGDEVLIRVLARPVHVGDVGIVAGGPADAGKDLGPTTPGLEGMGLVEALGPDAGGDLEVGARVAFFPGPGAWSELIKVHAQFVVPVPDGVSDAVASAMLVNPIAAQMLLGAVDETGDGSGAAERYVLQTAAGSSVGGLVSASAVRGGQRLVSLVRTSEGAAAYAERHPRIPVFSTDDPNWTAHVREATGGEPIEVALDAVGGSLAADVAGLLVDRGTLIVYGALSGEPTPLESLGIHFRSLIVRGVSILAWPGLDPGDRNSSQQAAAELAATHPELFEVAGEYDLADFAGAIEEVGRRGRSGIVVLTSRR